jgi:hypothetical protein
MASIRKEIIVDRNAAHCWEALRDVGALHTRLVPGFVTDTKLEPGARDWSGSRSSCRTSWPSRSGG